VVAAAAEAAVVAAVVAAAVVVAVAAALPTVHAAGAKPERSLTTRIRMAGLDKVDPAILCFRYGIALMFRRCGLTSHQKMRACGLNEETPVVGEYGMHLRTSVVGKLRVLTS
jgi:hypothetical protein